LRKKQHDVGAITRVFVVDSNRSVLNVQLSKFYLFFGKHGTEPMVLGSANRLERFGPMRLLNITTFLRVIWTDGFGKLFVLSNT
jgi:hypothetical protein